VFTVNADIKTLTLQGFIKLYLEWGISFVPLIYKDKAPALQEGEIYKYRKRQPNEQEIKRWFYNGSQHGIAAVCGFNNLVCLDFDDRKTFEAYIAGRPLPETFITKSARGVHLYFINDKPIGSMRYEGLKVELLGAWHLSTLPPSLHPSGIQHSILNMRPIKSVFGIETAFNAFAKSQGIDTKKSSKAITKADLTGIVPEGIRHETAKNYAKHLIRGLKLDSTTSLFELQRWNEKHCVPPLPEGELIDLVRYFSSKQRQISADLTEEFAKRRGSFAE